MGGPQADDAVALAILSHAVACGLASAARAGIGRGIDGAVAASVTVALVSPIPWLAATAALATGDVAAAITLSLLVAAAATTALLPLAGPGALAPLVVAALVVAHAPTRRALGPASIVDGVRALLVVLVAASAGTSAIGVLSASAAAVGLLSALLLARAGVRVLGEGLRRAR